MNDLYRELLTTYVKPEHITSNLNEIDPTNEKHFKNLEDAYFGLGVQRQISSSNMLPELVIDLKERCRKFIIKACVGIRKRYSLNDPVMAAVSLLDPDNCVDTSKRPESLQRIFELLPRLVPKCLNEQQQIDDQWRKLPSLINKVDSSQAPDVFWNQILPKEDFSKLANFMLEILSLPNSNAECERKFSEINDIKTRKRNRLITNTIKGNILARQSILRNSANCIDYNPNEKMMKTFTDKIYKNEPLSDSDTDVD
ncbi:unnamed protein product [Arctia plantaginis]|uniref:HAT C-terminal dimerisation domain-containing protein n=1 Tax=Arctia plantaginis TaxID=874455 RepID=A0A8S1A412_ARCPL|nr:unnamed protein product [Arctia plantaginis]